MNEIEAIDTSAAKVTKVSQLLYGFFVVLLVGILVATGAILAFTLCSGAVQDNVISIASSCLKMVLESSVLFFMVWVLLSIFKDISKGSSPFTRRQARRLRIAALLQIAHAAFSAVMSPVVLEIMGFEAVALGAMVGSSSTEGMARFIPINVGDIVLAVVLFCAALIVEYGSLLQQLSDDTL